MNRAGIFGWLALCSVPAAYAADVVPECDRLASHPEDPSNGRLRYQYARLLFYGNQTAAAMDQMRKWADAGHPQAQFVFDICLAEASTDERVDILSSAQEQSKNFYEGLVLEDLGEALAKRLMGPNP